MKADKLVVIETSPNECLKRIQADPNRNTDIQYWKPLVEQWWNEYSRPEGAIIVK